MAHDHAPVRQPTLPLPPAMHAEEARVAIEACLAGARSLERQAHAHRRGIELGPLGKEQARQAQALRQLAVRLGHDGSR